jgi:serine/threonine-protein phosphatase 6 regulatory ankyrin repeat subunit B
MEKRDSYGRTPLWLSASLPDENLVRLLIDRGAKVDVNDIQQGRSPLHMASQHGYVANIEMLLDYGANIEDTTSDGKNPLMKAVEEGHTAAIRLLFKSGANIEAKDIFRQNALLLAAKEGKPAIIRILLEEWRADINTTTVLGRPHYQYQ